MNLPNDAWKPPLLLRRNFSKFRLRPKYARNLQIPARIHLNSKQIPPHKCVQELTGVKQWEGVAFGEWCVLSLSLDLDRSTMKKGKNVTCEVEGHESNCNSGLHVRIKKFKIRQYKCYMYAIESVKVRIIDGFFNNFGLDSGSNRIAMV